MIGRDEIDELDELLDKANTRRSEGLTIEALALASQAMRLDSSYARPYASLFMSYHVKDIYNDEALYCIRTAFELEPKNGVHCNNCGFTFEKRKEIAQAILYLNKAIELDPSRSGGAYQSLTNIYSGITQRALFDLIKTMPIEEQISLLEPCCASTKRPNRRKNPASATSTSLQNPLKDRFADKNVFSSVSEYEIAAHVVELKEKLASGYVDIANEVKSSLPKEECLALASKDIDNNEYVSAISMLNYTIRLYPEDATAYCLLGKCYSDNGVHDEAIYNFNQAIAKNANYGLAYYERAMTYKKQWDEIKSSKNNYQEQTELVDKVTRDFMKINTLFAVQCKGIDQEELEKNKAAFREERDLFKQKKSIGTGPGSLYKDHNVYRRNQSVDYFKDTYDGNTATEDANTKNNTTSTTSTSYSAFGHIK